MPGMKNHREKSASTKQVTENELICQVFSGMPNLKMMSNIPGETNDVSPVSDICSR